MFADRDIKWVGDGSVRRPVLVVENHRDSCQLIEDLLSTIGVPTPPVNTHSIGVHTRSRRCARRSDGGRVSRIRSGTRAGALHHEPGWSNAQNAKTLVKYDDFRVVLIALKLLARLPEHQTEGRISIQTVAGHIRVRAQGRTFDLPMGRLLALDKGLPHDVEALEERGSPDDRVAWQRRGADVMTFRSRR